VPSGSRPSELRPRPPSFLIGWSSSVTSETLPPSRPVLVCGAGAAGLAAAISAARQGRPVWLIENLAEIGGTVTTALIHTLGGLFDSEGQLVNDGLPAELVSRLCSSDRSVNRRRIGRTWVLNVDPETYRRVVSAWLAEEPQLDVYRATHVTAVTRDEGHVLAADLLGPQGRVRVEPMSVVDATGTAEFVRLANPEFVTDDPLRAAGGLIFTLRCVTPEALTFPRGLGIVRALRAATEAGTLPRGCTNAWIDSGVSCDEVYVKLFVPLGDNWRGRADEITREAHRTRNAVIEFLQRHPGFERAVPDRTGGLGVREGGRIQGEYCLSATDVRQGRRFDDAACQGSWPIEYWDPVDGVSMEHLPDRSTYDIPLRCLKVRGLQNVWAAGKCLSADRLAQASARVVGTCWAMGEAAGLAAARGTATAGEGGCLEPLQASL